MDRAQLLHQTPDSALASLFFKVPHVADLILLTIRFKDAIRLLLRTEPALYHFFRGSAGGLDRLLKLLLNASPLAVLFFKAPNVANVIANKIDQYAIAALFLHTEPAICHFRGGPGDSYTRLLKNCNEGKRRRKYISRLPDLPRLLAEEWWEKSVGKRLVRDGMESGPDMSCGFLLAEFSYLKLELLNRNISIVKC